METCTLGPTDLEISRIGFGAMHLSLSGRPPEEEAIDVLHRVFDLGVTFIDTADSYCRTEDDKHHNERLIRRALNQYDGDMSRIIIATKGGLMRPEGRWTTNGDPTHISGAVMRSMEALERPIDLWQHHSPDPEVEITESLAPIRAAVDAGHIHHVGVSNYSVEQIKEAQRIVDVVSVQNEYSPWHREPEHNGVLDYCEEHDIAFLPWSPLGGSRRAKSFDEMEELTAIADEKGISPQRLILAWMMARSPVIVPIPGASRIETAEDSIAAVDVELSDEDVERIGQAIG